MSELDEHSVGQEEVRAHRSPRYFRFMLAAVLVLVVVAAVVTFAYPEHQQYDRAQVFGFLLLGAILVGLALGSVVALVVGWVSRRRGQIVLAERVRASADHSGGEDE